MITKDFGCVELKFPGIIKAAKLARFLQSLDPLNCLGYGSFIIRSLEVNQTDERYKTFDLGKLPPAADCNEAADYFAEMGGSDEQVYALIVLVIDWLNAEAAKPLSEAEKQASFFAPRKAK